MRDFDHFRESLKGIGQRNEAILHPNEVLKAWMTEENRVAKKVVVFEGSEYWCVPHTLVDELIEYIQRKRTMYSSAL